jgi:hypothetical protein
MPRRKHARQRSLFDVKAAAHDSPPPRIFAGLYPSGGVNDPCDVICTKCQYTTTAPTWTEAKQIAADHDWEHNA